MLRLDGEATGCGNAAEDDAAPTVAPTVAPDTGVTAEVAPMSPDIPDPITTEQIAAMSLDEAQDAYRRLSQALQKAPDDDAIRQRLWDEWQLVRSRVRELKQRGGS